MTINFLKKIKGSRIRNRFLFLFIILTNAPILVLGSVSLYLIDLSHRQDVSNLELQLISQAENEIAAFLNDTLGLLELRVAYSQTSEIDPAHTLFILKGILGEHRAFERVALISMSGKETTKELRDGRKEALEDVSLLPKFKEPREGKQYRGEVYYTPHGPGITLAAPVRNQNDVIVQVLAADVNLSELIKRIELATFGGSGYIALLDTRGYPMTAPPGGSRGANTMGQFPRIKRMMAGEVFSGITNEDRYPSALTGQPVVGAGKHINELGWIILAEWPLIDADAIVNNIRSQVAGVALVTVVTVIAASVLIAARLVKPISTLESRAKEIETGNFDREINLKTGDELEDLGAAFNRMAKGLKRLGELREEFVFVAAHELRAPVTITKGYLSLVFEQGGKLLSPQIKEFLTNIKIANTRLAQLVEDLLHVARSEAGRLNVTISPVDLIKTIQESIREVKPLADEKAITISYAPDDIPLVAANADRMKEICINLLTNAIKYNNKGGAIWIEHEQQNSIIITHVRDNGLGISKDAQGRLFEKFYRIQTEQTKNISGTGLGLFIVKQLVEKMKGSMSVASEEGKGSTFSFSIPHA